MRQAVLGFVLGAGLKHGTSKHDNACTKCYRGNEDNQGCNDSPDPSSLSHPQRHGMSVGCG